MTGQMKDRISPYLRLRMVSPGSRMGSSSMRCDPISPSVGLPATILRRAQPDLAAVGICRGQFQAQTVQQFQPVEPGQTRKRPGTSSPLIQTVKQPPCPDHIIGIIQKNPDLGYAVTWLGSSRAPWPMTSRRRNPLYRPATDPPPAKASVNPSRRLRARKSSGTLVPRNPIRRYPACKMACAISRPARRCEMPTTEINRLAVDIHDLDNRDARIGQHGARRIGMFQPRHDHARRPP